MEICGIAERPGATLPLHGRSLLPLLKAGESTEVEWPERILITDSQRIENPEKWRKSAVMSERWRLVNGTELGVAGGSLVMLSLGFPLATYINQALSAVVFADLAGGLLKSLVFGIIVAAVGCLRGLQTGAGASAVGDAATRAVVSGIVLIVLLDGLFSGSYYYLGS
jgi:hypothetical protein